MDIKKQITLAIMCIVSFGSLASADDVNRTKLQAFKIIYQVIRNDDELGSSERQLQRSTGSNWIMTTKTTPEGFITLFFDSIIQESSLMNITDGKVQPTEYTYVQSDEDEIEKYSKLEFDWGNKTFKRNDTIAKEPLQSNTQDILSFTVQIILDLHNGKNEMLYTIADRKRISEYKVHVVNNNETLVTDLGPFNTTRLETTSASNNKFVIWCANDYAYIPVKIMKIEPDGDVIELIVKGYNLNP